jgi:hypothetical protein
MAVFQTPVYFLHQVEKDPDSAVLILGCLFGHYPSLMVPLLPPEQDDNQLE